MKLRLYEALVRKLKSFKDDGRLSERWSSYLDGIGCTRIIRNKTTGWDYEDEKTPRTCCPKAKSAWKSLNFPGFLHVGNPIWMGNFDKSDHVIRMTKETAETIIVLGDLP